MFYAEDENFARRLQIELQAYENFKRQKENAEKENLNPIDSKLEYTDPTPSIHDLFVKFDKKFFWSSLGMVQVLWSNKMTRCAGMCSFEGGLGLCKISLSAPLLSLRPRKDLVETLLHEMIHAYLFVTHNYKDREDHGPEFRKHMYRINKEAGTQISVYHTFYEEVDYYQKHIWRCDGVCQKLKPHYGFVKRAINRAPGPCDSWWKKHEAKCGGNFIKISEPEVHKREHKKTKVVKPVDKNKDIRDYFKSTKTSETTQTQNPSNIKTIADYKNNSQFKGVKTNTGGGTVVVTNSGKNNSKVKNEGDQKPKESKSKLPVVEECDNSKRISANTKNTTLIDSVKKNSDSENIRETVRNIWANKFPGSKCPTNDPKPDSKKIRLESPTGNEGLSPEEIQKDREECVESRRNQEKETDTKPESSNSNKTDEMKKCPVCNTDILQSEMNDHLESCLSCTFENESDSDFDNEIMCESVPCPCCYKWFQESEMNCHIDECLTLNTLKEEILGS